MKGNEHEIRTMQSDDMAVRSEPVRRSGRLRKPPWRHRVGLGGRDQSKIGTLNKSWLSRTSILMAFFLISSLLYITPNRASDMQNKYESDGHNGRSLLSNVTEGGHNKPPWEVCDYELVNIPVLWVVFYAIFVLILFIAIAIICDDFFVPSLEVISETLSLSEDVAGATFMAAGSSAPELFTSVIGVAFESDVGVGTIVGSAVFNILIIIALTAALAGQVLNLDWRPLARDSFFYGMSLVCFIVFCWDTKFTWWEALILLLLYIVYLCLMKVNPWIMEKTKNVSCGGFCRNEVAPLDAETGDGGGEMAVQSVTDGPENTVENGTANGSALPRKLPPLQQPQLLTEENRKISVLSNQSLVVPGNKHIFHHVKHGELSSNFRRMSLVDGLHHPPHHHHHGETKPHEETQGEKKEGEEDKKSEASEEEPTLRPLPCLPAINMYYPDKEIMDSRCGCIRYGLKWVLFVISFPFMCAFSWTIPNCSVPHLRKWYVATFMLSIFWIAALSFGMVTLVVKMGCIVKISDYTMGLVIVAVGTSVPDALSSILVARDGYGDMAVSNAIGSNVFDINLGIGLPYLIRIAINGGGNIFLLNAADQLRYDNGDFGPMPPHAKFGFILLLILLLTITAFTAVRFRLNSVIGVSFALMYVLFMVYAFVQEIVCDGGC